jgi:hypothetical protein
MNSFLAKSGFQRGESSNVNEAPDAPMRCFDFCNLASRGGQAKRNGGTGTTASQILHKRINSLIRPAGARPVPGMAGWRSGTGQSSPIIANDRQLSPIIANYGQRSPKPAAGGQGGRAAEPGRMWRRRRQGSSPGADRESDSRGIRFRGQPRAFPRPAEPPAHGRAHDDDAAWAGCVRPPRGRH